MNRGKALFNKSKLFNTFPSLLSRRQSLNNIWTSGTLSCVPAAIQPRKAGVTLAWNRSSGNSFRYHAARGEKEQVILRPPRRSRAHDIHDVSKCGFEGQTAPQTSTPPSPLERLEDTTSGEESGDNESSFFATCQCIRYFSEAEV